MFYNNRPQIKLGKRWSFDAWGLLLAKGWVLAPATPKTAYLEVPASDGSIDITEMLSGEPRYSNRELTFGLVITEHENEWEAIRQKIENYCHGQRMHITLPHDPKHYFIGRLAVKGVDRQAGTAVINISAICDPWRYKARETIVELVVGEDGEVFGNLRNERRRVIPEITTNGAIDVTINNVTQSISAGTFKFTDFVLEPGNNPVEIVGAESVQVSFKYQEASL